MQRGRRPHRLLNCSFQTLLRRIVLVIATLTFASSSFAVSLPDKPPLPRARPAQAPPRTAAHEPAEHANAEPAVDQSCLDRLKTAGFDFEPISMPPTSKAGCAIDTPVRLKAVKLAPRSRTSIRLPDEPTLSCRFGERFGQWVRDLVAPLISGDLDVELKSVRTGPGFECRNRNRAENGKLSAHATGLAADVDSFELANGKRISVKPDGDEHIRATVNAIRVAACGWFTTVLGPGSDAAHAEHMHVDIIQHGSSDRYRICQ